MEIVLCTIPYTGTNFTAKLFTDRGFERLGPLDTPHRENAIYVSHMLKETQIGPSLELAKTRPVIIPIRHPYRVEESFRRKGQGAEELISALKTMAERFLPTHPYILPIDSRLREQCLREMANGLGINIETSWPVVASKSGTCGERISDLSPSRELRDAVNGNREFWDAYY